MEKRGRRAKKGAERKVGRRDGREAATANQQTSRHGPMVSQAYRGGHRLQVLDTSHKERAQRVANIGVF